VGGLLVLRGATIIAISHEAPKRNWARGPARPSRYGPLRTADDLGLVAELDGLASTSFADRAGVDVVQTDHPGGRLGHHLGQSAARLRYHAVGAPRREQIAIVDTPLAPITRAIAVRRLPFQFLDQPCPGLVEAQRDVSPILR